MTSVNSGNNFAVLLSCPTSVIEKAVIRLNADEVAKIAVGDTIATSVTPTKTKVVQADDSDTEVDGLEVGSIAIAAEGKASTPATYDKDNTYVMTVEVKKSDGFDSKGLSIADTFKDSVEIQFKKANSSATPPVEADVRKATFSHMNEGKYVFVLTGIEAKDVRKLASVANDSGSSTLTDSVTQGTAATKKAKVTLDVDKFYADDEVKWEITAAKGNTDGVTYTEGSYDKTVPTKMTATINVSEDAAPDTYTITATLNGDTENKKTASFTVTAASAQAKVLSESGENVFTLGSEAQQIPLTIGEFKYADNFNKSLPVTWTTKNRSGDSEVATLNPVANGSGEKSWSAVMTIPSNATPGQYKVTAAVSGGMTIADFNFDIVASGKKPAVTAVTIKRLDGSENGAAFTSGNYYMTKGDTVTLKAIPTSLDTDNVKYLWKVTGGTAANLTLSGETTDTLTITGKDLGEDFVVTVYASNNDELTADNASEKKEATAASGTIHVVQYSLGVTAVTNVNETVTEPTKINATNILGLSYGYANLGTSESAKDKTVAIAIYNGSATEAIVDTATWTLSGDTKLGKSDAQVSLTTSGETAAANNTLTLASGNRLQSPKQYKVTAKVHGIDVTGTIEIAYDWQEVKVIEVKQGDNVVSTSTNEYFVTKAAAADGVEFTATGKNKAADASAASGGTVNYTWAKVNSKDEITISATDAATTRFTSSKLGTYELKVTAKNDDNDARGTGDAAADKTPSRIIKVTVVDYKDAVDGVINNKVDEVAPESGSKTYQFSVKNDLGDDGLEDVETTTEWSISGQNPVENSTGDKIYTINKSTGLLTINPDADAAKATHNSWSVKVTAKVNGITTEGVTVTLFKTANAVEAVNAPTVKYGDSDPEKKDGSVYVLGLAGEKDDYLRLEGSVNRPANATNKEVSFKVIEKATTPKEVKLENTVDDALSFTAVEGLKNTYDVKGLKYGTYYIYAYSSNGTAAKPDVFSTPIEVKVVDYRLYVKDAAAPSDAAKDVEVTAPIEIPVEVSREFDVKTIVPATETTEETKTSIAAAATTILAVTVGEDGTKGTAPETEFVKVTGKSVQVIKYTAEPIEMVATAHGLNIPFTITTTPTELALNVEAYAGDQSSTDITSDTKKYAGEELDLNSKTEGADTVTIVANVSTEKGNMVASNRSVTAAFAVVNQDGKEVALTTKAARKVIADITYNEVPVSDGEKGYNTVYAIKLVKPVDLKVYLTADGNEEQKAEVLISGSRMGIYYSDDAGYTSVDAKGYNLTSDGSDVPQFVVIKGKENAEIDDTTGVVTTKARDGLKPDAAAVWTFDVKILENTAKAGTGILEAALVSYSKSNRTTEISAKTGDVVVGPAVINIAKFVPVASVEMNLTGIQKISKGSVLDLEIKVKGDGGVPTMIGSEDYLIQEISGSKTAVRVSNIEKKDAETFTVKVTALRATKEDAAVIKVYSPYGLNNNVFGEVAATVSIEVSDYSVVYGSDETLLEGDLNVIPGEPIEIAILDNETGKLIEGLKAENFSFDPEGKATYANGKITVDKDYEGDVKVSADVNGTIVSFIVKNDAEAAAASLYITKDGSRIACNNGRFTIDLKNVTNTTELKLVGGEGATSSNAKVVSISADGTVKALAEGIAVIKAGEKSITVEVVDTSKVTLSLAPDKITLNPNREFNPDEGIYDPAASMYLNYNGRGVVDKVTFSSTKKNAILEPKYAVVENKADTNQSVLALGFDSPTKISGGKYTVSVEFSTGDKVSTEVNVKVDNSKPNVTAKQTLKYNSVYNCAQYTFSDSKSEGIEYVMLGEDKLYNSDDDNSGVALAQVDGNAAKAKTLTFTVKVKNYRDPLFVTVKNSVVSDSSVKFSKNTLKILNGVEEQVLVPVELKAGGQTLYLTDGATVANADSTIVGEVQGQNIIFTVQGTVADGKQYIKVTDSTYGGEVNVPLTIKNVSIAKAGTKLSPSSLTLVGNTDGAMAYTNVSISGTDVVAQEVYLDNAEEATDAFNASTGVLTVTEAKNYAVRAAVNGTPVGTKAATLKVKSFVEAAKAAKVSVKGTLDVIARDVTMATITVKIPGIDGKAADVVITDLGAVESGRVEILGDGTMVEGNSNTFTAMVMLKAYEGTDDDFSKEQVKAGITIMPKFTIVDRVNGGSTEFQGPQARIKLSAKAPKMKVVLDPVDKTFTYRKDGMKLLTVTGTSYKGQTPAEAQEINRQLPNYKGNMDIRVVSLEDGTFNLNYSRKGETLPKKSYSVPLNVKFAGYTDTFKTSVKVYIAP